MKHPRIIHGHVDAGIMRLSDKQIHATRFSLDPMPIDCCEAMLIVFGPGGGGGTTAIAELAVENERLRREVADLDTAVQQMASDLVTWMDDPHYGERSAMDIADDDGLRRDLSETDDFADPLNGGFSDASDPAIVTDPPPPPPPPDRIIREGQAPIAPRE